MANLKRVETANAPAAIGPYSQAVMSGNNLYLSGQIAIDPATNELVMETIETETHQVLKKYRRDPSCSRFRI